MTNLRWSGESGYVTLNPLTDPLAGDRVESFRWELLDLNGAPLGLLDGVTEGRFEFSIFNTIRGGGSLTWSGTDVPDWLRVMVQPWYEVTTIAGSQSWPLGVFIPAAPSASWGDDGISVNVELYDKLLVLDQDKVTRTATVAKGANVTTAVKAQIAAAGETAIALVDSTETLSAAMTWEAGTSRLQIVNDLLDSINYFSLSCDGFGVYHAEPYVAPAQRGVEREFYDNDNSVYLPDFEHERDTFDVPNVVTLVSRSDGATPSLIATATNASVTSPTSTVNRGRQVDEVITDVEATSQAVLNDLAARKLRDLSRVSSSVSISHAPVPLDLNDAVRFRNLDAGLDLPAVVQKMSWTTALPATVSTELSEVVE